MELTLENVKKIKNETNNKLTKCVCDYIVNEGDDEHEDNNKKIFLDIINYGCANSSVHGLVYSCDILNFYEDYECEINFLLSNLLDGCGFKSPVELFGDKGDSTDPLACADENKNLLAGFGFKETIKNIANEFGIEG